MKLGRLAPIVLITIAVVFLLRNYGIAFTPQVPGVSRFWPLLLVGAGLYALFGAGSAGSLHLGGGVILLLLGGFLLMFTLGFLAWPEMNRLWPVIPLVIGVGLLLARRGRP